MWVSWPQKWSLHFQEAPGSSSTMLCPMTSPRRDSRRKAVRVFPVTDKAELRQILCQVISKTTVQRQTHSAPWLRTEWREIKNHWKARLTLQQGLCGAVRPEIWYKQKPSKQVHMTRLNKTTIKTFNTDQKADSTITVRLTFKLCLIFFAFLVLLRDSAPLFILLFLSWFTKSLQNERNPGSLLWDFPSLWYAISSSFPRSVRQAEWNRSTIFVSERWRKAAKIQDEAMSETLWTWRKRNPDSR